MGRQKQAVLGGRPLVRWQFEEALDGMHFTMPERIFDLVIGFGYDH